MSNCCLCVLTSGAAADSFERDLSRTKLANIDLSGLELRESDLAFADSHRRDTRLVVTFFAHAAISSSSKARVDEPRLDDVGLRGGFAG
jgi:uncharacterized protein YjbI with pentapeptide repeats